MVELDRCDGHGVSSSGEVVEERVDDAHQRDKSEHGHHRREVERPERRQDPPEEPQVRLADVAQEPLIRRTQSEYGSRTQDVRMYTKISRM